VDVILSLLDSTLELIFLIFSWKESPYNKEADRKQWIRVKEFDKYVSFITWMTDSKELKPYYMKFTVRVERLMKINSSTWAFAYFKEVLRLVIRALAGTPEIISPNVKIRVKRDHYGLPKMIPFQLRGVLRMYIDHANSGAPQQLPTLSFQGRLRDEDVLMYSQMSTAKAPFNQKHIVGILTLLSIFRVFKTKVEPDFSTITLPFGGFIRNFPGELVSRALQLMFPKGQTLNVGRFKPFISSNAGPNGKLSTWAAGIDALAFIHNPKVLFCLTRWMYRQKAYFYLVWLYCIIILIGPFYWMIYYLHQHGTWLGWLFASPLHSISPKIWDWYHTWTTFFRIAVGRFRGETNQLNIGKLGVVYDQAGKARVVAATNWWIQSAFHGLHQNIFKALKTLPTDGTFDQDGAFDRFISKVTPGTTMSGFDLSAATDRLPIDLQAQVLNALGIDGDLWRDILDIEWYAPLNKEDKYIKYSVGQPMGALSSWAMLALTHHVIVNVARVVTEDKGADKIKDLNYCVLGDDFVISNDIVAKEYVAIMEALGLEIKLGKSVISTRFTEFAKKLKGPNLNFTPIGPGAILSACRSGYMIPAVFMSAIGSIITSPQEVLDLVNKVPSGLVARPFLGKFMSLVLWQLFNAKGPMTRYVNRLGRDVTSLLNLNSDMFNHTASPIYVHIFDSMSFLYTKDMRSKIVAAKTPMVTFITNCLPLLVSSSPSLRVLETLIKPINPGFWVYLKEAFIAPIILDDAWTQTFETLPNGGPSNFDSYSNYWSCIRHLADADNRVSILELKFTKSENKMRARYYQDLYNDMKRRYLLSERYTLNRRWYE
jgi:hypothetical protein